MNTSWSSVLEQSFQNVSDIVIRYVPQLIVAILILLIGWILGALLGRVVAQIIRSIKLDEALKRAGVADVLRKGDIALNSGRFLGELVKWFIIIVFLVAALDVLKLEQVTLFLNTVVLGYLPQVIVAALIILIAAVVGDVMGRFVSASAQTAELKQSALAGKVTRWAIWIFALLIALDQLGVDTTFIHTAFTGIIVALSLGIGIAFGLGGQETAARMIEKTVRDLEK